jgi:hypothetical protein
VKYKY